MRLIRLQQAASAVLVWCLLDICGIILGTMGNPVAHAQSVLAGDVAGTVTDQGGAAIVSATVKITSKDTGSVATTTTSSTGAYRFSLLKPGPYTINVSAQGFKAATTSVVVNIGQIATQNIQVTVGSASETVEVTAGAELLQTDSADLTTQFDLQQLQTVPNPGGDITYVAQTAPGAVMDTGGGYGNFSVFGLPGTSNNFTQNGMQTNDPFLNLNNSGPSNLLLGLNDIAQVSVVTNAYNVQFGSFGGAQVNAITRSGGNAFHGNLNYWWNGDVLNANDWFFNHGGVARPFSNSNQWAAAVGGPIKKDHTFFFANYEGLSFITSSQSQLFLPSPAFESSVVGSNGSCNDSTSSLYTSGAGGECALYNNIFTIYNNTPNHAKASVVTDGTGAPTGQLLLAAPAKISLTEKLFNARVDQAFSDSEKMFVHFKYDHGVQPTYNDPINSAFNAQSDQPDYEGQFSETHSFGTRAVNQVLVTGSYYSALFVNANPQKEMQTLPFEMRWFDGLFTTLNNNGLAWPEGRNVTQVQFGDDYSYTKGKHTLKAGFSFKKDYVSDHDTGILTVPLIFVENSLAGSFGSGQSLLGVQNVPKSLNLPLSLYSLGFYVQDDWKPADNLTITAGIRFERNSNPACAQNCLSNFGGNFFTVAASAPLNSASAPYNQQIKYNLPKAFTNYLAMMAEPRLGFTWSPSATSKTVVRGGFGIFTDIFPGTIADTMLTNPPLTTSFTILGAPFGGSTLALNPSDPTSVQSAVAAGNATFQSSFKTGGSFATDSAANPNFAAPNFTTVASSLQYPTYDEWSLQVQRALSHTESIQIGYVGNHGYHEPVQNVGVNASLGAFGIPAAAPAPSFGSVTEIDSTAVSNFNGLVMSYIHQGHNFNAQLNYQYSHALDEISNGGILPFTPGSSISFQIDPYKLKYNYGNADYDVRQYLSGNYLYMLPHFGGPKLLTDGWEVSGTIFANSGTPFTPQINMPDFGFGGNYDQGGGVAPLIAAPGTPHHCGGKSSALNGCFGSSSNFQKYFPSYFDSKGAINPSVSPFGGARNQFTGPKYFDTDMTLLKTFKLPFFGEAGKFDLGATAYNLFNHTSFAVPNGLIDNGSGIFGYSLNAVGPPTSIYGSFLGGDDTVRIIQMTGKITF